MWKAILVEDEKESLHFVKNLIHWEDYGFTIVGEARNGQEALERIEAVQPHLVITDIMMPLMDGVALLKECRRREIGSKFIMLSCLNDFEYARSALEFGASNYLLKLSLDQLTLIEALRRMDLEIREQQQMLQVRSMIGSLPADPMKKYTDHHEINQIIDYIHHHLSETLTLTDMADKVRMDPSYLSDLFKKKTGMPLIQYIQKLRIEHAKFYLSNSDLPTSLIAEKVGFSNDNYFIRVFRKWTDYTPSEYRKQYAGASDTRRKD